MVSGPLNLHKTLSDIDEALFGREVIERMPDIVKEWVRLVQQARG